MKAVPAPLSALAATIALAALAAGPTLAAQLSISVTGAPATAKQGETKSFTINVSATGGLNRSHSPASVHIDTVYTAGGGSGTSATRQFASSNLDVPASPVTGGPYSLAAEVTVPIGLAPGQYTITVAASAGSGLELPSTMPSFLLEVEPASARPSVSILSPESGACYKVNEFVPVLAEVTGSGITSVTASLDGGLTSVALAPNAEGKYEGLMQMVTPGSNTLSVTATNAAGSTTEVSTFTVKYDFAGWLPPITTAKMQRGRMLPVKFRVGDYFGQTDGAVATVLLDGVAQGVAQVLYDEYGLPFYQLEVRLPATGNACEILIQLNDGVTAVSRSLTLK